MNKPMYQRYAEATPVAIASIFNTFGIAVFEPDETDRYKDNCDLIIAWANDTDYTNFHKHMIHYTESGRGYIRKGSFRIYLDDMISCREAPAW